MEFLKVIEAYPKTESVGNGLAILNEASNVKIRKEINGINSLEFEMPNTSKKISFVKNAKNWYEVDGERYFPLSIDSATNQHTTKIVCRHIIALTDKNNIIPDFPIMAGVSPIEILQKGLELCGNNYWELIPQDALPLGMKWVDKLTDIVEGLEKITLWELIKVVLELEGYGELYVKNQKFAIVEKIGNETPFYWSPKRNIENIKQNMDYSEIANCLLVLGANDMTLDTEKYPGSIIRSEESIQKYGECFKIVNFPDITDPTELEEAGLYEISSSNPNRVDIPKISITVSAYELNKNAKINLGDSVRIASTELDIDEVRRVVGIEEYPLQPIKSKYTIGDKQQTLEDFLANQYDKNKIFGGMLNEQDKIKTDNVQQISPSIQSQKNFVFNSSFEVYDVNGKPKYWECTDGALIDTQSQNYGSVSLKLPNGEKAVQTAAIFPEWYETESNGTMICFSHKWGAVKVRVLDADGNPIPHMSKYNPEKVLETVIPYDVYYREFNSLTFLNGDIASEKKSYRIEFTGMGDDPEKPAYVDNVMATYNNNGIIPLYRDGAESISYSQIGSDTGSGQGVDENSLFKNVYFNNLKASKSCTEADTLIHQLTIKNTPYIQALAPDTKLSLTTIQTFSLRNITGNYLQFILKKGGNEFNRLTKSYKEQTTSSGGTGSGGAVIQSAELTGSYDAITIHKTIDITAAEIMENDGIVIASYLNGTCDVIDGTALTCILSKSNSKNVLSWDISKVAGTDSVTAEFDEDTGTLTIYGVGEMKDWKSASGEDFHDLAISEKIKTININDGVTNIGEYAFSAFKSLTSASISESVVDIGQYAFNGCQILPGIDLPSGIKTIENRTFAGCKEFTDIVVPEGVISLQNGVFSTCSKLANVSLPSTLQTIGDTVFSACVRLEHIEIPDSVTEIKAAAFVNCGNLKTVKMSAGLTKTDGSLFNNCTKLESIEMPITLTMLQGGDFQNCRSMATFRWMAYPAHFEGEDWVDTDEMKFYEFVFRDMGADVVGEKVAYIDTRNTKLREALEILGYTIDGYVPEPEPTQQWDVSANDDGSVIAKWYSEDRKIVIDGTGKMKDYTSSNNPPYHGKIGSVNKVIFKGGVTHIGARAFYGYSQIMSAEIQDGVESIGNSAFWTTGIKTIDIPNSVNNIGAYAFASCSYLSAINFGNGVVSIGDNAFNRGAFTSIEIPDSVKSLGIGVFSYCSSLTNAKIGSGITKISDQTFYICEALTSIEIPNNITEIGKYVFANCSIPIINIPNSVKTLGNGALSGCKNIADFTWDAYPTSFATNSFNQMGTSVSGDKIAHINSQNAALKTKLESLGYTVDIS